LRGLKLKYNPVIRGVRMDITITLLLLAKTWRRIPYKTVINGIKKRTLPPICKERYNINIASINTRSLSRENKGPITSLETPSCVRRAGNRFEKPAYAKIDRDEYTASNNKLR
jgi:hypothetical protein